MRDPLYWTMISAIYRNPGDTFLRTQLADWLDDNGHTTAAKSQRAAIEVVKKCGYLVKLFLNERREIVIGYYYNKKRPVIFEIKKDSRIVFSNKNMGLGYITEMIRSAKDIKIYKSILGMNPCKKMVTRRKIESKNPCNEIPLDISGI